MRCLVDPVVNDDGVRCLVDPVVNDDGVRYLVDPVVNDDGERCTETLDCRSWLLDELSVLGSNPTHGGN